ncbi:hypothetical protein BX616_009962 [Lobosporangium transversale]|uniref:Peptide hydrolase n=1 Tax=Lobosporangium transversale TaxID=64571 RepID=A0A1Y2GQI8_9FUNG|nr:hypothetical protein BCR41DRAFT_369914 [Lobosporangium transversale]KAF9913485.1 hypothetical protein BX616_009962 [Lobosporangium transversale]ORZ19167.1 hypothetical protein BCR41DRAFT_369914 [Lobosporangium transversale]|eukprot:XP_021882335.1 hypothetical protein BCR41DRAFT_369914 [Lobosporangium transversale]
MVRLYSLVILSLVAVAFAVPTVPAENSESLRLIRTSVDKDPFWTTEKERLDLIQKNVGFMDITDHQQAENVNALAVLQKKPLPTTVSQQSTFARYVGKLKIENMESVLVPFTKFHNRYYEVQTGLASAKWLQRRISNIISKTSKKSKASVRRFKHSFIQFSIIARIEGTDPHLKDAPIILGAHLDSINSNNPIHGRAPGADDDGSGTVVILEVFRALLNGGFKPVRPIEFHWYAGEEGGLLGSQDIAERYNRNGIEAYAMLQNDMTAYTGKKYPPHFALVTDFVDPELTALIKLYAETYADIDVRENECGYGCSDHASWTKYGYRASFAIEAIDDNPLFHTAEDDLPLIDYNHMMQFAKLSLAFVIELSSFSG